MIGNTPQQMQTIGFRDTAANRLGSVLRGRNSSFALMLAMIAVRGIFSIFRGEKIPINGGFGWDGFIYGAVAQHISLRALDPFYFQRIVPSLVVHYGLVVLRQPLDNQHVILAFGLLDLAMLLLSCALYRGIAGELKLGAAGFWFGFGAMFVNFACYKMIWYCPVQTDITTVALSLAMLLSYLRNMRWQLFAVALIGAFTWPTLVYVGLFLFMFPRHDIGEQKTRLSGGLAIALAAFICGGVFWHYYVRHGTLDPGLAQPIRYAMPLSTALSAFYIYKASSILLRSISLRAYFRSLSLGSIPMAAMLFIAAVVPGHFVADHNTTYVTMHSTVRDMVTRSVVKPLVFMVSHPIYFGPAFLVLVFLWAPFTQSVRRHGIGLVLVIWLGVFTSLTPETRQSTPSYFVAIPFLALIVDNLVLPRRFFWLFGALAVASTKFWMHMDLPAYDDKQWTSFPLERFFMNVGPWMNNRMYLVQGLFVLLAAVLLYSCLHGARGNGAMRKPATQIAEG